MPPGGGSYTSVISSDVHTATISAVPSTHVRQQARADVGDELAAAEVG